MRLSVHRILEGRPARLAVVALCASLGTAATASTSAGAATRGSRAPSASSLHGTLTVFDWDAFSKGGGPGGPKNYKDLIDPWLKLHPGVSVTIEAPPASVNDWVVWENTVLSAGTAPAVISPAINMQPWLTPKWYYPLNSMLSAPDPYVPGNKHMSTLFAPKALQEWNDSGTYYSIAYTAQDAGLVYNKTIFQKAGIKTVPGTWAQLFADCAKIAKLGDVPVGMDMGDTAYGDPVPSLMAALFSNSMQPVFDQIAGGSTANITVPELVKAIEDGQFSMKSPGFSEAWNLLKQFSHYFEPGADSYGATSTQNSSLLFARGKVGMVYVGSYEFPTFTSDHLSYGIFPLPQLTRQTWSSVSPQYQGTGVMSYWDDWPWSISADAVHKGTLRLAENLLQWLAVPKHQDTFAANLGDIPVASSGATVTPSDSQSAPLLSVVDYIVQHPSPVTTALTAVLGPSGEAQEVKIMQEYVDGQLSLSGALSQEESLLHTSAQATRSWVHV